MSMEDRLLRLENSFNTLVELARGQEERLDTHLSWINQLGEAQTNSERKIEALADSHIRLEGSLALLGEAQVRSDAKIAALADSQLRTDEALRRLAEAQAATDDKLSALADRFGDSRDGR